LFLDHHHRHPFFQAALENEKMAILISLHLPQPINPTLLPFWKENRNMVFLLSKWEKKKKLGRNSMRNPPPKMGTSNKEIHRSSWIVER
jgi:hypothetical protein